MNEQLFKRLDIDIDVDRLKSEVLGLITTVGWSNNQIALQYSQNESWHQDVDRYGYVRQEHLCDRWNIAMDGSYMQSIILAAGVRPASARIMLLPPITCYITHVDFYTRFQIPVVCDPVKSFLVFNQQNTVVNMQPGDAYWINTHEIHNYVNGAYTERINIIFNDADEQPYVDNPYIKQLFGDFSEEVKWR